MKITKVLPLNAKPAKALLARAKKITLKYAERVKAPAAFSLDGTTLENALGAVRPLEVGDVLVDEKGGFYVVEAAEDRLMRVTGDAQMLHEAAYAFMSRGIRLAEVENGFAMIENEQFRTMLTSVGLKTEAYVAPFVPVALPEPEEEEECCCCGHHHHHHDGECGCGHHHHHDEEGECGCGHHHHHEEEGECCCGHHHHDEEECGCGHHHHEEEGECSCGHHHHHDEEECGCGHHHHHEEEGECCCGHHHHDEEEGGCGHHHHHEEEGECCCGHHHHHDEKDDGCCCGHNH